MKSLSLLTSLLVLILLSVSVNADIQYYGINTVLNENGLTNVKITITFDKPTDRFKMSIIGKIENFQATSIAGPINCTQSVSGITVIDCLMELTEEKRTIELSFDTFDFVKILDDKSYFDVDFSPNENIREASASVTLPEGTVPSNETIYPRNPRIDVIGKRIIINWKISDVTTDTPLRFQILYEKIELQPLFSIRLRYFVILGAVAAFIIGYVILRYLRKSEKLVLSVLDEYERKVMDIILGAGGIINQKKIVLDTNLSKAKISRVIKSLEERGLIEIERLGRTNKIKLLKKKLKL